MSLAKRFFTTVLACLAIIVPAIAQEAPRQIVALSDGWRFRFGDAPNAVTTAGFDDSGWEQVSVPHTWNRIGEYALTRSAATNNAQGVGWYRLTYAAPPAAKGRRQYLDFAAVAIIADVWVNGAHVGRHKGAFSRFRFDVTAAWHPGAANLIVVKADNSKPAIGSTTQDVIPLAGDFFIHGGIYRGVSLITANDVGIDLLDMGGPGVYVSGQNLQLSGLPDYATYRVKFRLRNAGRQTRSIAWNLLLDDAESHSVLIFDNQYSSYKGTPPSQPKREVLRPGEVRTIERVFASKPVRSWNGVANPYRYRITVEVRDGPIVLDSVSQSFGLRTFRFDPNDGFHLNPSPFDNRSGALKLHGVSRHQDRLGKGYALSREDHAEDMAIMKEMGVNAVRMAHYQHADEWADEADKAGMLVWAEVPYVTTPSLSGGEGSAEVFANAEQQLRELIRQNYNHPSIVMWSIGNEVDASALFGLGGGKTKPLALLQHLQKVAKEEDPSRPTTFADCCEDVRSPVAGLEGQAQEDKLAGTADMIGYNRYYGWYYPEPLNAAEQLAAQMDKFHVKHPTLPISISEYGAGGAITQHSDNPTAGFVNAIGRPQPEEYENWVHEQSWPVIRERPYIYGSFVWNMFDFASDLRNEGDAVDINTKGLVTMDRKTRKDAFYYYKAQWSHEDFIHLTGQRYMDRAYSVMDVRAYTTLPKAFLQINGSAPIEAGCPGGICIWKDVRLRPGPNRIMATAPTSDRGMPVQLEDAATFNGPDLAQEGLHLDAGDISGRMIGTRRFGSDNFVTGGTPAVLNQGGFGGRRSGPLKTVTAPDPALYDYWREGDAFSYTIPVPDGKWTITIHTFEPRAAAAENLAMTVKANGAVAIPGFNVAKAAGGPLKGLARSFTAKVRDGMLRLEFSAAGGKAVVAAIEVRQ